MKTIKILVMTPKYADYEPTTKDNIKDAIRTLPYIKFTFISVNEVYIHSARRKLLTKALELNAHNPVDYFLWLDSDIEFRPKNITRLISLVNLKNLVTGIYFSRHNRHNPMICYGNIRNGFTWTLPPNWEDNIPPFTIDGCGFGFLMMSKKIILEYTSHYPSTKWFQTNRWYPSNNQPDEAQWVFGEDLYFCRNARKLGYKIWADAKTVLLHKGIGYNDYLNRDQSAIHCETVIEDFNLPTRNITNL